MDKFLIPGDEKLQLTGQLVDEFIGKWKERRLKKLPPGKLHLSKKKYKREFELGINKVLGFTIIYK